jgi:hypothetical protein
MKQLRWLWVLLFVVVASGVAAHDLGIGDVLISENLAGSRIETDSLTIVKGVTARKENDYDLTLTSKETGLSTTTVFTMNIPTDLDLVSFDTRSFCGESILLVTLRYDNPRGADILGYSLETHAFREKTLGYLASVDGDSYDIAPLAVGADIGFPYEMPQAFGVVCSAEGNGRGYAFSFVPGPFLAGQ